MIDKKKVSLKGQMKLRELSEREQQSLRGGDGSGNLGGCSCPCPVRFDDASGYLDWDAAWAQYQC